MEVEISGISVGVVRNDSQVRAFRNTCPHQGAPLCFGYVSGTMLPSEPDVLDYGLDADVVRCPWHGWEFHLSTGAALFGTSRSRIIIYKAEVRDGDVFVLMPAAAA